MVSLVLCPAAATLSSDRDTNEPPRPYSYMFLQRTVFFFSPITTYVNYHEIYLVPQFLTFPHTAPL